MRDLFRCSRAAFAAVLLLAVPAAAQTEPLELVSEAPDAAFFENEPGRTWLSDGAYQAERYVVCKVAAPQVLAAIEKPETTPGAALQAHMQAIFEKKGCTFEAPADTFRVNGVFLSLDMEGAKNIRCEDKPSKLVFRPGVMSFLDTIYFLNDGPPR